MSLRVDVDVRFTAAPDGRTDVAVCSRGGVVRAGEAIGHKLIIDVGESRFDDITDGLPRPAVELNQSHLSDRSKVERSCADFDPR